MVVWRPPGVARADGARVVGGVGEGVEEGGLADARRAEERGGGAGGDQGADGVDALVGGRAHGERVVERGAVRLQGDLGALGVEIGLREDEGGRDLSVRGEGEVALEAAGVQIAIEGGRHEGEIDVGAHDLDPAIGIAAHEGPVPVEAPDDPGRIALQIEDDPVPDDDAIRLVGDLRVDGRGHIARGRRDGAQRVGLEDDPPEAGEVFGGHLSDQGLGQTQRKEAIQFGLRGVGGRRPDGSRARSLRRVSCRAVSAGASVVGLRGRDRGGGGRDARKDRDRHRTSNRARGNR